MEYKLPVIPPYQPGIATPKPLATGAERQGGTATPLAVAGGLASGLTTPISSKLDPALEAEIRSRYIRLFNEITVEEVRLQQESVETWGSLTASIVSAHANLLSAVAEGAKATAMSNQAVADALGPLDGMLDMANDLRYFEPDSETWQAWKAQSDMMDASVQSVLGSEGYGTGNRAGAGKGEAYSRYVNVLNGSQVRALDQVSMMVEHAGNLTDNPVKKTTTVMAEYGQMEARVRKALATMAAADGYDVTEEELEGWTQDYMGSYVAPVVFGNEQAGQRGLVSQDDMSVHNQKRAQATEDLERYLKYIDGMGAGLDPRLVDEARYALRNAEAVVAGGPLAFADTVAQMPTPQGTTFTKQMILNELARLNQGDIDPLNQARKDILKVPGFDVWMQAMGFQSVTRAMIYAGNHPYEIRAATKAYVQSKTGQAPPIVGTPQGMREWLKDKGDEEGIGFQVTPLGRAVAMFTGRRNLGFDFTDKLDGIRQRLEAYEPRTELMGGMRERLLQGLDQGLPKQLRPQDYPEGQDPEGLYGEDAVSVIEADVAFQKRMNAERERRAKEIADPGFREVAGAGGYKYKQYADGKLEIIETPTGAVAKPIEVPQNGTAYAAIVKEIGSYQPPEPTVDPTTGLLPGGAQGPEEDALDKALGAAQMATGEQQGQASAVRQQAAGELDDVVSAMKTSVGEGNTQELEEIAAAMQTSAEPMDPMADVPLPAGREGEPYEIMQLDEEHGGWKIRVFPSDLAVQVVDAPLFEQEVGKTFTPGTYQNNELMRATQLPTAKSVYTKRVEAKKQPEPTPEPAKSKPATKTGGGEITLMWMPPGSDKPQPKRVQAGSENEAWWRSQGAYDEGQRPQQQAQAQPKLPVKPYKPIVEPASAIAQGFPGDTAVGNVPPRT